MPKVSVVMPVYNGEKYLEEAVESILRQEFTDFEFIIIEEYGSNEVSKDILKKYEQIDTRIIILHNQERIGIAASLNKGILKARGKYIARMDADDIAFNNRLTIQVKFMDENTDITICGSEVEYIDENGVVAKGMHDHFPTTPEDIKAYLMFYCVLRHPTVMMRRQIMMEKEIKYNEDFRATEDFELWTRASKILKMGNIENILLKYRFHELNSTSKRNKEGITNYLKVINSNFEMLGIDVSFKNLEIICPLTCKVNEKNKYQIIKVLKEYKHRIYLINKEKKYFNHASLKRVFKIRMGWANNLWRHRLITFCRKIIIRSKKQENRYIKLLNRVLDTLEMSGYSNTIKMIIKFLIKGRGN